jgi:tight adherence protein B
VSLSLLTLVAFLAAALTVAGVYSVLSDLVLRDRSRTAQRVDAEFSQQRARVKRSSLFKDLGKLGAELLTEDGQPASPADWLQTMIDQSGLSISPRRLLAVAGLTGLCLGLVAGLLARSGAAGAGAALLGPGLPLLYVHIRRRRRCDKLLSQLPDALELMARAMRAGQSMAQALQAIADEFEAPIGPEFAYCYEQQNLGLPLEIAFQDLARRTGLIEVKIFILAMVVQRQTGGNLSELLEKLAGVLRERFRVQGKIRVLTAEGRAQAAVLQVMPPVVFVLMLLLNRKYAEILLDHPNYLIGIGVSMLLGAVWIRRIVNFDF